MSDAQQLVARLRDTRRGWPGICRTAADAIERLLAELADEIRGHEDRHAQLEAVKAERDILLAEMRCTCDDCRAAKDQDAREREAFMAGMDAEKRNVRTLQPAGPFLTRAEAWTAFQATRERPPGPEHVCGLQGFGRGVGSENDRCPACEAKRPTGPEAGK